MARPNRPWLRKDTGVWYVTIAGNRIELVRGGKKARKAAELKYHELMAAAHRMPVGENARVADIVEEFLDFAKRRYAADTYRNYRFYGQKFAESCGKLFVYKLKPRHVTKWIDKNPWNETTEYNARRTAFRCLSWACEEGIISENPLKGMKRPRPNSRNRALTIEEYRQVLAGAHGPFRILVFALWNTGARPSEARRLTWDQVREDRWVIDNHKTAHKTKKARIIYLPPPIQRLMRYLRERSECEHVFVNTRGKPWTSNAIRLQMQRIKQKYGLSSDVCTYLLRHSFGTNAVLNGLNSSVVAELMGHTSTEMVDRVYVHLADQVSHLQDAVCRATRSLTKRRQDAPNSGE